MGQWFQVLDLDGRTELRLGELGENLRYERTTAKFIDYLRLKHNVDSPSKEQVKKWTILCPDPR
jgi:hypothetical protein